MEERGETATLAGGCFWCLEAAFERLQGVVRVTPGYTGGQVANPSYRGVCTGTTGHAEAVQITFDPGVISFREVLEVFFSIHDPTTLNYQGNDVGTQYRSAIFYHSPEQKQEAVRIISEMEASGVWPQPIVTELKPLADFYPAEEYHHQYYRQNPEQGYCQVVIAPKLAKFHQKYAAKLKEP
jgi:peptide-methionine (S)-S-oxide reductase